MIMSQLVRPLLIVALLFQVSNAAAQEVLTDTFTKESGCCSSHGRVSNHCQDDGRVICNDGWRESSCFCEEMSDSIDQTPEAPSVNSDSGTTENDRRSRDFSGLFRSKLDYITELIGDESTFGSSSNFENLPNADQKYLFKIRNFKRNPKVIILRPFKVQLDQVIQQTRSGFTIQGIKLITNLDVGEQCQEIVQAEFNSINRTRPNVVVTRFIDCLSGKFKKRWGGELKRILEVR